MKYTHITILVIGILIGTVIGSLQLAHADPQPALDRALVERMVRAAELTARSTEAAARCRH